MTNWIILTCKGGSTLRLSDSLNAAGFEAWTPVLRATMRRARWNAKRDIRVPLCAGLVFAKAEHLCDMLDFASMPVKPRCAVGLKGILRDPMDRESIPQIADKELDPLREAELPAKVRRRHNAYRQGDEVRIIAGGFTGINAVVDRSDRRTAKVWISIFGQHRKVEIPTSILRLDRVEELQSATDAVPRLAA